MDECKNCICTRCKYKPCEDCFKCELEGYKRSEDCKEFEEE